MSQPPLVTMNILTSRYRVLLYLHFSTNISFKYRASLAGVRINRTLRQIAIASSRPCQPSMPKGAAFESKTSRKRDLKIDT